MRPYPYKRMPREETDIHTGRMPENIHKDRSRDLGDVSTSQEPLKIFIKPPKARRRGMGYILSHSSLKEPSLSTS